MIVDDLNKKYEEENVKVFNLFIIGLDIDEDFVFVLVDEGFIMLEEVVYVLVSEFFVVDGLDEDIVEELCNCVCVFLIICVLVIEELLEGVEFIEVLLGFEGMSKYVVYVLVSCGIIDFEELVE